MGKAQRLKGHNWEREIARRYNAAMPGCNSERIRQESKYAAGANDVSHPLLHTECKAMKKCNFRAALKQAEAGAPEDKWPVAICKDDQEKPGTPEQSYAVMRLDDFLELMAAHWKETK